MPPVELNEKIDGLQTVVTEFKKSVDKELAEVKAKGEASGETKSLVEKLNKEISTQSEEIKKIQTALNRSSGGSGSGEKEEKAEKALKSFQKFLRTGDAAEYKANVADVDADGGYLVLDVIATELQKKIFESSPIRQLASVVTTSSDNYQIIEDTEEFTAGWVTESAARPATATPQFGKHIISVHEMYAKPEQSQKFLDDAFVNVEAWLTEKLADKFGRLEATAFVSGNGTGQPKGFMDYADGTGYHQIQQVVTGDATLITADSLIKLIYSLKSGYKQGAAFLMKRSTLEAVRKLKDLDGQYLWAPGLNATQPDMLLGYPVYEANDMAAVGAGLLPVAFGNFAAGYQIVDRIGIRTLRNPFANPPFVQFYSTKRVGGAVKNFESIKILKVSV
jgi:HK97 family phage major capsid protein